MESFWLLPPCLTSDRSTGAGFASASGHFPPAAVIDALEHRQSVQSNIVILLVDKHVDIYVDKSVHNFENMANSLLMTRRRSVGTSQAPTDRRLY